MQLKAIRVSSLRGTDCVDVGECTCFYMKTACNANEMRVGLFKCGPQVKLPAFASYKTSRTSNKTANQTQKRQNLEEKVGLDD